MKMRLPCRRELNFHFSEVTRKRGKRHQKLRQNSFQIWPKAFRGRFRNVPEKDSKSRPKGSAMGARLRARIESNKCQKARSLLGRALGCPRVALEYPGGTLGYHGIPWDTPGYPTINHRLRHVEWQSNFTSMACSRQWYFSENPLEWALRKYEIKTSLSLCLRSLKVVMLQNWEFPLIGS